MLSFLPTFALSVLTPGRSPHAVQAPALHASSQLPMQAAPLTSRRELIVQAGGLAVAAAAAPVYAEAGSYPKITVATTAGTMEFELWDDVAPGHVKNMLTLAKQGFFDGGAFHRIIPGFVVQGGDPNTKVGYGPSGTLDGANKDQVRKWGRGGPGYNIKAEFNPRKHEFGVLSMARSNDPDSAGSQFFICLGDLASLDNKYTTFGKLTQGGDVLRKLASAKTVTGDIPFERQGLERIDPL
mmetsp:Transcript_6749/g.22109  ORF Transcript_6749/g.22109 Transcript_6749/m.22109 type:complete len:240 (-) Transcript_6749:456-1175(-)